MPPLTEEQLQELLSSQFGNRGIASLSQAASPLSFQFEDAFTPYSPRQMLALETMRLPGTEYPFGYGTEDPAFFSDFTMGYNFDPYKGTKEDFNYLDGTRPGFQYDTSGAINETPMRNLGIDTSFGVANEPDVEQVETLEGKSFQEPTGIRKLFNFLSLFSPVGLITRGLGSLSGLNNRLRNTDFGLSKNLADFIDMKKYGGFEGRERARRRTMTEARDLQRAINRGDFNRDRSGITDRGRGDRSPAPSRPSRSAPSYEAAGRAFARGR